MAAEPARAVPPTTPQRAGTGLLAAGRLLVLGLAGTRHAATLARLGAANARVLRGFERACARAAGRRARFEWLAAVWLPFGRYTSLFRPYPALETREERLERRRLAAVHAAAEALSARHAPTVDPVTAPSARALQAAAVKRVFARLFGLSLAPDEALVLAGYGSVGIAARDFLEYCGCARGIAPSAPLALQLPAFVVQADLRHERLAARGKSLALRERAAAFGDLRAGWDRLCHVVCRVYWARGDARERLERMALRVEAHRQERLEVVRAMREKFDPATQESVLAVLADHMHLKAALLLAELTEETKGWLEARGGPTAEQASRHEFEFLRAAHGLEDNLRAAIDGRRAPHGPGGRKKGEDHNG